MMRQYPISRQEGFTLTELMVALTVGLIVLSGLTSAYVSSSHAGREQQAKSEQVENGRLALEYLGYDLHHAGYYGQLTSVAAAGVSLPDPCETADLPAMLESLAFPVQGYDSPAASPIACLDEDDFVPGTDVLVVRRVSTEPLAPGDSPQQGAIYLQSNSSGSELQIGNSSAAVGTTLKADGTNATLMNRGGVTAAPIRQYLVQIYFVAPCAMPADGGMSCTGAADDDGNPIPTLKRMQLTAAGGAVKWSIVPLVAGIENLQFDYGVDDLPADADLLTGLAGDGAPDCSDTDPGSPGNAGVTAGCAAGNPGAVQTWANVVQVKASVLTRSYRSYAGYTDSKTYELGLGTPALIPGGAFKRHAYSTTVRVTNVSSRREIPL